MSAARARQEDAASVFAALGDATRLELVSRLSNGGQPSITELAHGFALSRQAVTKHLRVLEDAGLVRRERVGRESRCAMHPRALTGARAYLSRISDQWDEAVTRLRAAVED